MEAWIILCGSYTVEGIAAALFYAKLDRNSYETSKNLPPNSPGFSPP
jgi:hypothetical protein